MGCPRRQGGGLYSIEHVFSAAKDGVTGGVQEQGEGLCGIEHVFDTRGSWGGVVVVSKNRARGLCSVERVFDTA